jgi:uncharacterized protein YozE (UPF0346 family)
VWHTYFVTRESSHHKPVYVKIGKSRDPVSRVNNLQTSSPTKLRTLFILEGDRERELHAVFAEYRVRGEWFRVEGALKKFITEYLNTPQGPPFYDWLIDQKHRQDDIGRLALIAQSDPSFPRRQRRLIVFLKHASSCYQHLLPIIKSAHKEYRNEARVDDGD